ncbi:MAG: hypothetical protein R3195_13200 [Gemmatimonadota bacterium]|nr:hypothetical protein [Gemmatimonadota bacterium]
MLRGTLIGAGMGLVASLIWWNVVKEADDNSAANGYAAVVGIGGGALIGLGVSLAVGALE